MDYEQREQLANLQFNLKKNKQNEKLTSEEIKDLEENLKFNKFLNDITNSERKDFINLDFYIEVEDRQYGRMLAEFCDDLSEGCLEQAVLCKREEDEDARLVGRYTDVGDTFTEEESKILKENRWCSEYID